MIKKIEFYGNFFGGKFSPIEKPDGQIKDFSPSDLKDEVISASYALSDVDKAVDCAKSAFLPWARLAQNERNRHLLRLKEVFEAQRQTWTELIARDSGKPLWEAETEAKSLVSKIDITLNASLKLVSEERISNALPGVEGVIRHKPRGVMAVIGPFNFPAHLPNGHIIPALAMGNTVVFKPSELTPAVGQFMAECYAKAELPSGVFNMIHGEAEVGRKLVLHEDVDGVLFTGSYEVGLKIKQETLQHHWKILALEMGGKNSTVVWQDAEIDKAVYESLIGCFMTAGQRCSGTSRIIVHPTLHEEFTEKFYQAAKKLSIGHWSENPFMGPLISAASVEKYLRFQEIAKRENCENIMRGKVLDLKHKGHYVTPSINLAKEFMPSSIYQKSEIFGPNVAIYNSGDFDEVLRIVNSTGYGLAMAIFTKDESIYSRSLLEAKVGILNWNRTTNGASSRLPFGGMGKSGNDRPSAHFAVQYCSVPVASLEDHLAFDATKVLPGISFEAK